MKRKYIVGLHILFWTLLITNNVINSIAATRAHNTVIDSAVIFKDIMLVAGYNSIMILCFYGSYFLVSPALFLRKNYLKALLMTAVLLFLMTGWRYLLEFWFFKPVLGFDNYKGNNVSVSYYVSNIFWYYFPKYFVYGLLYFSAENWIRNRNRQEALQREKLSTELAFLRSQINPHFLFNTINDIYSLTYQKSDEAPVALLKLSKILRYMLYEGARDKVPLHHEVEYLNDLVELQRIGSKGLANISFEIEGYVGGQEVAPLLFVAFVENAFKHGVLNDPDKPVCIQLKASNQQVEFSVSNSTVVSGTQKDQTSGIGLSNIKRRLELIYPGKHELIISEQERYSVYLKIQLGS
ncbi:histidine kinase [Terrimonas sp. NA20]|uniref:Histidine kinase n=1 Tax=Terrimonas ginsenosidimutans TaxID=2908004 RepID=A0ABS9KQH5_9BACT|nr:histidine kinase [Terrimonas ginsenosidimutans]MCG2614585.1 histidine kinase [Terrimonas ginsenosidimutans]